MSPEFGSLADVERMLAARHELGLRVLLDLVAGHTSDRHPWFAAARSSRTDPKRAWYLWADGRRPDGGLADNWVAEFGGPAWTLDPATGQWYHHSFYPEQPDLNWRNPAVGRPWPRSCASGSTAAWTASGWTRIQYLIKDARLRDNPPAGRARPPWPAEPGGLRRRGAGTSGA